MKPTRRILLPLILLALAVAAPRARAEDLRPTTLGAGFHDYRAPIGVRWWIGENHALDLNVGFQSDEVNGVQLQRYDIQVGVPIVVSRFGRLLAELRPGVGYESRDTFEWDGLAYVPTTDHLVMPGLEIEAELMVVEHLSISGGFGVVLVSTKNAATGRSDVSVGTTGGDFAHVGFHLYFGGAK